MSPSPSSATGPVRSLAALAVSLALVFAVAGIGGWVTAGSVSSWYPTLVKPAFNPPNWIFGPVWTTLYALMGFAAWRVWRALGTVRGHALALYGLQLALNLMWSVLFFGLHRTGWALAEIAILFASIVATGLAFRRIDAIAGLCFVPYALWVAFAALLNASIWWLN